MCLKLLLFIKLACHIQRNCSEQPASWMLLPWNHKREYGPAPHTARKEDWSDFKSNKRWETELLLLLIAKWCWLRNKYWSFQSWDCYKHEIKPLFIEINNVIITLTCSVIVQEIMSCKSKCSPMPYTFEMIPLHPYCQLLLVLPFCDLYCHSLLSWTGLNGCSESRGEMWQPPEVRH